MSPRYFVSSRRCYRTRTISTPRNSPAADTRRTSRGDVHPRAGATSLVRGSSEESRDRPCSIRAGAVSSLSRCAVATLRLIHRGESRSTPLNLRRRYPTDRLRGNRTPVGVADLIRVAGVGRRFRGVVAQEGYSLCLGSRDGAGGVTRSLPRSRLVLHSPESAALQSELGYSLARELCSSFSLGDLKVSSIRGLR